MQLFCNFSFVLFFQKGRALARISLFERSERDLLFFTLLFFYLPPYPRIMGVSHMVMEIYLSFNGENSRQISDGKAPQTTGK